MLQPHQRAHCVCAAGTPDQLPWAGRLLPERKLWASSSVGKLWHLPPAADDSLIQHLSWPAAPDLITNICSQLNAISSSRAAAAAVSSCSVMQHVLNSPHSLLTAPLFHDPLERNYCLSEARSRWL